MKKLINNYTTDTPVDRTLSEIQQLLVQNGARGIALEYNESGTIKDTFFKIILTIKNFASDFRQKRSKYIKPYGERNRNGDTYSMVQDGGSKRNVLPGVSVRHGLRHRLRLST